ncbi:MAG: adenosine deaminase [Actinobacteria bacterium]|nr:adenosine deaminase [Actinomycetota bacterium]
MKGAAEGAPAGASPGPAVAAPYPRIELHVHLEATVSPARLLEIARRNDVRLPAKTAAGLARFCRFKDFDHFIRVWINTTKALRRERDFHQVVVDYAADLAAQGCFYAEALFSPSEPMARGTPWRESFEGYCGGADEAREVHGVDIRFTPDITRDFPVEIAEQLVDWAVKYRERGVVGVSLGGSEHRYPPELFARPFARAREGGLKAAPHAGEVAGPTSVRGALDVLHADRLRHGVRAAEDPALLAEIASRDVVCDVTPTSNVLLGVVPSLAAHPLPRMLEAGVRCSISSDDPALMGTSLSRDCAAAVSLGHTPRGMFEHALGGVFCEEDTKVRLRLLGEAFDWTTATT